LFVTGLRCLRCGRRYPAELRAYLCEACGEGVAGGDPGILDVEYDYDGAARRFATFDGARDDLFRYLPVLPVGEPGPGLPAGGTPLVPAPRLAARLGLRALYIKDETRNPTRCLKDRATAIAVAIAESLGRREVYCASAGNAAISLAGFAAHLGWPCHVFVPSYASRVRLDWLRRYGADVRVSAGDYDQAFAEAEAAGREHGWYSRNCAYNPFLVEGKKTAALEIADQLGGRAPDWVVAPVGDGCTLGAIGKGFREARRLGRLDALPRLLGVQAEAVRPLVDRHRGESPSGDVAAATTRAHSIAVRRPRNALRLLGELDASEGRMVAAPDDAIAEAQRLLAEEAGIVAEFTSAATLAGLIRLRDEMPLDGRTAVLVVTGGRLDEEG
jgi:threonine synthase